MRAEAVEKLLLKGTTPLGGVRPRYRDLGLPNAASAVLRALGVQPPSPPIPDEHLDPDVMKGSRTVVLLLVDGLGYRQLRTAKRELGGLALLDAAREGGAMFPLASTVPSTTTSAIGSICTGVSPQEHGVMGYRLFLPEYGTVANMIRFAPADKSRGPWDPAGFFGTPTVFELAAMADVPSHVLTRERYVGSALSLMVHRGATMHGFASVSDFAVRLRRLVEPRRRRFVFAYWDMLDTVCHRYGTEGEEFLAEVASLDAAMEREVLRRVKGATLVLLADHGHINTPAKARFELKGLPELLNRLAVPPTGEPRLTYLHAAKGVEDLEEFAEDVLGDLARVCTAEEAFEAGLFGTGPIHPAAKERVGDVLLMPKRDGALMYGYPGERLDFIGRHGGLSAAEMLVPFLVARL